MDESVPVPVGTTIYYAALGGLQCEEWCWRALEGAGGRWRAGPLGHMRPEGGVVDVGGVDDGGAGLVVVG